MLGNSSQLNSTQGSNNSLFGGSSNTSSTIFSNTGNVNPTNGFSNTFGNNFTSKIDTAFGSNTVFSLPISTNSIGNKTNGFMFNQNSTPGTSCFLFGGNLTQNGLNINNQNTLASASSNNATPSTFGSANAASLFGLTGNSSTSQSSFGFIPNTNAFPSIVNTNTTPSMLRSIGNSNIANTNTGSVSQIGVNSLSNSGSSNLSFPSFNVSSNSTFINSSVSQSSLTFGTGTSNQTSTAFSFGNQQNPTNTFAFQSNVPTQSTVSVTPVAGQNILSFGTPITTNNILGSNIITAPSNFATPLTSTSAVFSINTTTSLTPVTLGNKTSTISPFPLGFNLSATSTVPQTGFIAANTGLGGVSASKLQINNASPLVSSSVSAKKGLGGSPISESSKSVISKDAAQKISVIKQVKDIDLLPELKETVETFKKFVTEQKKLREEIIKSNDVVNLMIRVEEESQILRQSISDVANGLQKIQVQSNKLKSDICKEQSNIKIAQTSSDTSITMTMDRSESSGYFSNKIRELENRAGLYLQEIEVVESMCNSSNKSSLTTRDLVEIIRKMDDEFIGLAAKLYIVHERVKTAKTEYFRRYKQNNNQQNPFLAIEGRFGDTFESISGLNNNKMQIIPQNSALKISDSIGGSPFDNNRYINKATSFSIPKANNQKPSIFGMNNNNNQANISCTTIVTTSPFTFSTTTLSKPPTNLFLNDSVSNKKRR